MRPLDGVRILDLTVAVAGPVATALLGDLGADVVRVEAPWPRPTRHLEVTPALPGRLDRPENRIVSYNDLHRSKRSVMLDLATADGRGALLDLAARSDALVENMAPRVLPGLGLGYDDLSRVHPALVMVSMPAFGLDGPLRDRVSYGPGIDAISGLSHLTGYADRGPMNPANYYGDYNTALLAVLATLAGLRHRDHTGEGQHVEVAMLEGELQVTAEALMDFAINGCVQSRTGNAHASMSPHGVYPCAGDDRWLALACEDDAQWHAICAVIGGPELATAPHARDVVSRIHNRAEIDAAVSAWTRTQDPHAAMRAMQDAGVAAAVARTVGEVFDDPRLRSRDFIQFLEHPEAGRYPHARAAFSLSKTPARTERHAPLFAEEGQAVLEEILREPARVR